MARSSSSSFLVAATARAALVALAGAVVLLLLLLLPSASAGDWRGRPHRLRTEEEYHFNHVEVPLLTKDKLPESFSWANARGRHLLVPSWNQHEPIYCGSCFAHATLSMISDRLKILKNGQSPDVMLSRQTFLNCAPPKGFSDGCDGGDVADVFGYMAKYGLPDESCLTYNATDHTKFGPDPKKIRACPAGGLCRNCMPVNGSDTCWAVETPVLYYLESFGRVGKKNEEWEEEIKADNDSVVSSSSSSSSSSSLSSSSAAAPPRGPLSSGKKKKVDKRTETNEVAMMSEIYQRGPIVCSIATPDDFVYGYRGGVYVDRSVNSSRDDVDHDVEVVGWGRSAAEEGRNDDDSGEGDSASLDFWIVRNSWGTFWGELGFVRVQRGVNALFVEDGDCWYAAPEDSMERRVRRGELVGTMYGVVEADEKGGKKEEKREEDGVSKEVEVE